MQNSDGPAIQADKDAPLQPSTITASTGQLPSIAEDREVHIEILKDQGLLDKEARDAIARRWTKIEQDMLQTKLKPSDYMPEQEEFSWVALFVIVCLIVVIPLVVLAILGYLDKVGDPNRASPSQPTYSTSDIKEL